MNRAEFMDQEGEKKDNSKLRETTISEITEAKKELLVSGVDTAELQRSWAKELVDDPRSCLRGMIELAQKFPRAFPLFFGEGSGIKTQEFLRQAKRLVSAPGYRGTNFGEFTGTLPFKDADWVRDVRRLVEAAAKERMSQASMGEVIHFPEEHRDQKTA